MKKTVTACTKFEGIHCWPEAPDEVKFLRVPHRHMFGIRVEIEVNTNDRDIEFIMVKHVIDHWLGLQYDDTSNVWQMGRLSCEQVAEMVIDLVQQKFDKGKKRTISCTVDEDGENGATVTFEAKRTCNCSKEPVKMREDIGEIDGEAFKEMIRNCKGVHVVHVEPRHERLSLQDYQELAYTAIQKHQNSKEEVMHWAIGLGEEAGETLSVIKHKYYGGKYNVEELVGELGDTLWHIGAICSALGVDLEDVAVYNLMKLRHRYPEAQFDNERSIHRHDLKFSETDEAKALMEHICRHQKNC